MSMHIVGAGFGSRYSDGTFSGVPRYLFRELEQAGVLDGYINTRQFRATDLLHGVLDPVASIRSLRPRMMYRWVWKKQTYHVLTQRFNHELSKFVDANAVLQIGTHVAVHTPGIKHFCLTDMTIAQVIQDRGQSGFPVDNLSLAQLEVAYHIQKDIFANSDFIFTNSHWVEKSIVDDYGIPAQHVSVTGVGASVNGGDIVSTRKRQIVFIGRDWNRKGGVLLLEAFQQVKQRIPDARLIIIGSDPGCEDPSVVVHRHLDKNKAEDRARFEECLAQSMVLCVPSLYEPYGICFLEAQYYGVVPVTLAGQGREDTMIPGETGIVLHERNADSLANILAGLLEDPVKVKLMGQAGRKLIHDRFTWPVIAEKCLAIMRERMSLQCSQ